MITAKVGTFKRKQQMRDFLDHLPKDNHDDVFTATPFQNRRVKVSLGKQCIHVYAFPVGISRVCYKSAGSVLSTKPRGFWGRGSSPAFVTTTLRLPAVRTCGTWLLQMRITAEWMCKTSLWSGCPFCLCGRNFWGCEALAVR